MRRTLTAGALLLAWLLVQAGPAMAGQVSGSLTIETQSSEVWFEVGVAGTSVPAPTMLADPSGEHVSDVAVTMGSCPARVHAGKREIGLTGATWCVHVSDLQAGYSVSGTIASPATSLSLTVKRKVGPGFPLLWSLLALVVASVISLLSNAYVPGWTSRLRLRRYQRDGGIAGLGAWVKTAAERGLLPDDDIVARAQWARSYGRKQVIAARSDLRAALTDPAMKLPMASPLVQSCEAESSRQNTDISREDLLTDKGAASIKAAALLDSLNRSEKAVRDFTASADHIISTLTEPSQVEQATNMRDGALNPARRLPSQPTPQFFRNLNNVIQAMQTKFSAQELVSAASGQLAAAALSFELPRTPAAEVASAVRAAVAPAVAYIPAVLLAFVVMAGAVATVFSAQYLANPSFGTITDYWTLGLSAYGSAQATAIAAALLLIRSPKPWYG